MMSNAAMAASDVNEKRCAASIEPDQLLTVRQFCSAYPWPSEAAMRAYIYKAPELGISSAFIRVNRRVLIAPAKFFSLIKQVEHRNQGDVYEATSAYKGRKS